MRTIFYIVFALTALGLKAQISELHGQSIYSSDFIASDHIASNSSMSDFFKYRGVEMLAGLAHPFHAYESGAYGIYSDCIIVEFYQSGDHYTKLRIDKEYGLFTKISVIKDTHLLPPFTTIWIFKELLEEAFREPEGYKTKSWLEKELGKAFDEFDGFDISLFLLNVEWIGY